MPRHPDRAAAPAGAAVPPSTTSRRLAGPPLGSEFIVLGRAVRELRARRFLTQAGLGTEAGLHRNYVGAIERGEINSTFRILRKLATGLQLPLSELVALFEQRWDEWEADRC